MLTSSEKQNKKKYGYDFWLTRSHSSIHSQQMSIGSVSGVSLVSQPAWHMEHEISPMFRSLSKEHPTLFSSWQNGQRKTVSSLSFGFTGRLFDLDFLLAIVNINRLLSKQRRLVSEWQVFLIRGWQIICQGLLRASFIQCIATDFLLL